MVCACVCICLSEWYVRVYVYAHGCAHVIFPPPPPLHMQKQKHICRTDDCGASSSAARHRPDIHQVCTRCIHEKLLLLRTAAALNTRMPATYWPMMRAASRMQVKRNILHVSLENKYATDKKPQTRTKDHRVPAPDPEMPAPFALTCVRAQG